MCHVRTKARRPGAGAEPEGEGGGEEVRGITWVRGDPGEVFQLGVK